MKCAPAIGSLYTVCVEGSGSGLGVRVWVRARMGFTSGGWDGMGFTSGGWDGIYVRGIKDGIYVRGIKSYEPVTECGD